MRDVVESAAARLTARAGPGVGIDVEEVERWRAPGLRLDALFSLRELAHARVDADPPQVLAGLWCAKEATFKALAGEGGISLRDISIDHTPEGAPLVIVHGELAPIGVSISHTPLHAAAIAVRWPTEEA